MTDAVTEAVPLDLTGKVALVTGGASGIGRASAERLARAGATVVVVDVAAGPGAEVAAAVGGRFVAADVADPGAWSALVADVERTEGGLDVTHLNAGVTTGEGDVTSLTDAQYRRILGVNVDGVVFGCRAVVPVLVRRGGGAVVATASMAGLVGFAPDPVYTMTKHAVVGLVRALAPALEPDRITVNAVCPSLVDTPLVPPEPKAVLSAAGVPFLAPEEVADTVLLALSSGRTGEAWVCRSGARPQPFDFPVLAPIGTPA